MLGRARYRSLEENEFRRNIDDRKCKLCTLIRVTKDCPEFSRVEFGIEGAINGERDNRMVKTRR